ncbi:MAG: potassium channel family protein [Acidobacteriota bacterium]|jgi:hypothetical protein
MASDLRARLAQRKYAILLVALLVMILVPVIRGEPAEGGSDALWGLVLIAGVQAAARGRGVVILLVTVGSVALAGRLLATFGPRLTYQEQVDNGSTALAAIFLAMTIFLVYSSIIRSARVNADSVMGAVAVYLLIGIMWTNFYAIAYNADASSFNFPEYARPLPGEVIPEYTFGYYSFVTLTTLGYGDITPTTFRTRTLSWLEAVFGVTYMATVIAFLVSRMMIERRRDPPETGLPRRNDPPN